MSVLLQISDTHFGTEQSHVVEALVELAVQQRPDVVVIGFALGDWCSQAAMTMPSGTTPCNTRPEVNHSASVAPDGCAGTAECPLPTTLVQRFNVFRLECHPDRHAQVRQLAARSRADIP